MTRLGILAGIIALGWSGVFAQQNAGSSADAAAIAKVRSAFQQAAAAQDAAALAKLFTPDGEEMPPNAPAAKGRAAIEAYHKQFAQQFMVHGVTITATETHVAGNLAYDVGTYKQTLMAQKSGAMFDDTGKYVVLLRKEPAGGWLITHVIYNSNTPAPGAAAKK